MKYLDNLDDLKDLNYSKGVIKIKDELKKTIVHWSVDTVEDLLEGINLVKSDKVLYIEFIPDEFVKVLEDNGFKISSEWKDYWNNDLNKFSVEKNNNISVLDLEDIHEAYDVVKSCEGLSNDFEEQELEWFEEFLKDEEASIFKYKLDGETIAVLMNTFYGHKSEKGKVFWLREIAVRPEYHNKGYGNKLIKHALNFAISKEAKRAFLACDALNFNAIHLYNKLGFHTTEESGQINMIR